MENHYFPGPVFPCMILQSIFMWRVDKGLIFHVLLMRDVFKNWCVWSRSIFFLKRSSYLSSVRCLLNSRLQRGNWSISLHCVISEEQNKYEENIRRERKYNNCNIQATYLTAHSCNSITLHISTAVKHTASPRLGKNYATIAAREQILCNYIINHTAIS